MKNTTIEVKNKIKKHSKLAGGPDIVGQHLIMIWLRDKNETDAEETKRMLEGWFKCDISPVRDSYYGYIPRQQKEKIKSAVIIYLTTFAGSSIVSGYFSNLTPETTLPDIGFVLLKAAIVAIFPAIVSIATSKPSANYYIKSNMD